MADKKELRKTITEILDGADLTTITAKKVRQQLEEKLKIDLTDRKKEVDALTMEVLNEKQDTKSDSNEEEEEEEEEESEEEEKPKKAPAKRRAPAKHDSDSDDASDDEEYKPKKGKKAKGKKAADSDSDGDWKKKKPAAKRGGGGGAKKGGGTGYTKVCKLSPALAAVMGEENMARHEVVKRMWKLIKEKNLYDPKNKQFAICNEELLAVFGVKRFRTFGMMKYLKNHFTN